MFKKTIFFAIIVGTFFQQSISARKTPIKLERSENVIRKFDGRFGLTGENLLEMERIQYQLRIIRYGKQTKEQKKRQGKFIINEVSYCLKELAQIEEYLEKERTSGFNQTKQAQITETEIELKKCLETAIQDFINTATPFLDQVNSMKQFTLQLMNEWAEKHDRPNSFLLDWGKKNRGEVEMFQKCITSCRMLDQFCDDLDDFLYVFIENCPKAKKQLEKIKNQYNNA